MRNFQLDDLFSPRALRPLYHRFGPVLGLLSQSMVKGVPRDAHVILERVPPTERDAADQIASLRWPHGWRCEACAHAAFTTTSRPRERRCRGCGKRQSVTAGTALHGKHDLRRWFAAAISLGSATPRSANGFAERWGCDKKTAWATFHLLRRWAAHAVEPFHAGQPFASAAVGSAMCRPDKPTRPARPEHNAGLLRGARSTYCHRATFVRTLPLFHLAVATDGPPVERHEPVTEVAVVAAHCAAVTDRIHGTVSPRWMMRYREAMLFRANLARRGHCARREILRRALGAQRTPYRAMAPP